MMCDAPGFARALHSVHSDATDAGDEHDVARLDVGVRRRTETGLHAAGDQVDIAEGQVLVDLDQRELVVDLPLGERAEQAGGGDVGALVVVRTERAVHLVADHDLGAVVAEVLHAHRTPAAALPQAGMKEVST